MNIKSSINLIRGILYLHEIIRCKSISRAAEENNMKASNLGIIINDLENRPAPNCSNAPTWAVLRPRKGSGSPNTPLSWRNRFRKFANGTKAPIRETERSIYTSPPIWNWTTVGTLKFSTPI